MDGCQASSCEWQAVHATEPWWRDLEGAVLLFLVSHTRQLHCLLLMALPSLFAKYQRAVGAVSVYMRSLGVVFQTVILWRALSINT